MLICLTCVYKTQNRDMSITWWFRTKKSGWPLQFNDREHCSKLWSLY